MKKEIKEMVEGLVKVKEVNAEELAKALAREFAEEYGVNEYDFRIELEEFIKKLQNMER